MRALPLVLLAACAPTAPAPAHAEPVTIAPTPLTTASANAPAAAAPTPPMWRVEPKPGRYLTSTDPEPTEAAWKKAEEATIWGLSALGCSARQTSTWLRIECPFGMTDPKNPVLNPAGNGAWQARWTKSSVVIALPIGPGLDTRLIVAAGQGLSIELEWRYKTSRPPVFGYVNEAMLPACEKVFPDAGAGASSYGRIEDCRRRSYEDCDSLAKCLRGEPSHIQACPDGWEYQAYCVLPCKSAADCGPGWSCDAGPAGTPVCLLP